MFDKTLMVVSTLEDIDMSIERFKVIKTVDDFFSSAENIEK